VISAISYLKQKWHLIVLLFIWLYSAILQFIWLVLDRSPPWGDGISFVLRGMSLFQEHSIHGWEGFIRSLFRVYTYSFSPPVIEITYFLYYKIFGIASEMEIMVNSLYLALGIIGIYGIGNYLYDKYVGLFSALIFASLPGVILHAKSGFKEFHITCFLALAIYLLFKANDFKNRRFSILFAISFAVMLLIKLESIIFIVFPLAFIGARAFSDKNCFRDSYRVITIIFVLIITFAASFFWYANNFFAYMQYLSHRVGANAGINSIYFSTKNTGFYAYLLYNVTFSKVQAVIFIAVSTYIVVKILSTGIKTPGLKQSLFLLICFAFPFLVFTFLCEKDMSHILPLSVFVSLIMASWCSIMRNKIAKYIIVFVVVLHCINIQLIPLYALGSKMKVTPFIVRASPIDNILHRLRGKFNFPYGFEYNIAPEIWEPQLKSILEFIDKDCNFVANNNSRKKPSVLLLANLEPFRFFQMEYCNMKIGSPISLINFLLEFQFLKEGIFSGKYDYIVTEQPPFLQYLDNEETSQLKMIYSFIEENQDEFNQRYKIVKAFELPGLLEAVVYRSRNLERAQ